MNYLEELISEWYEYNDYFLRRNIKVSPRSQGGYEGEIDIVAFDPKTNQVIHIETSSDTYSWDQREKRYRKKFELGEAKIREEFKGFKIKGEIRKEVVLLFGAKSREYLGGGRLKLVSEYLAEIYSTLKQKKITSEIVSEQFPLLRTIQLIGNFEKKIKEADSIV